VVLPAVDDAPDPELASVAVRRVSEAGGRFEPAHAPVVRLLGLSTAIVALGLRLSGQRFVDVMRRS